MNNVYEFKQWYIITDGTNDFKVLLTRAQYHEISMFFPVHRASKKLFSMVEYNELKVDDIYNTIQRAL